MTFGGLWGWVKKNAPAGASRRRAPSKKKISPPRRLFVGPDKYDHDVNICEKIIWSAVRRVARR